MSNRWLVLIATALLCAAATVADAAPRYRPIGLGTLGGRESCAGKITNSGRIVGAAQDSEGRTHLVEWVHGEIVDLYPGAGDIGMKPMPVGLTAGLTSAPNNDSAVAGTMTDGNGKQRACAWRDGKFVALTDGTERESCVSAVNDAGQIVGYITGARKHCKAMLWSDGKAIDLGDLGGYFSRPMAINSQGHVVGWATHGKKRPNGGYDDQNHAFVWRNGVMTDLGTMTDAPRAASAAMAINDRGQIAGLATTATDSVHAVVWNNGVIRDLGALEWSGNDRIACANALNDRSQIVGASLVGYDPDPDNPKSSVGRMHAVIIENGVMQDLNRLIQADSGWELLYAFDINDSGLIVGIGYYTQKGSGKPVRRAYLLVPLSETDPAAYGDWHTDPASPPSDPGLQTPPQPSDCDEDQPAELPAQAGPDQPVAPAPEQSEVEEPEQSAEPAPQQEADIPTQTSDGADTQNSQPIRPTPTTSDGP